jgi:hypothetical protein
MIDISAICARIQRLSIKHDVDALSVVGLLAVHALCEVNFAQLRVWRNVAENMRGAMA